MISLNICGEEKTFHEINTDWISRIINRNRIQGNPICVKVNISSPTAKLSLITSNCDDFAEPNGKNEIENRIIYLWEDLVINQSDIFAGTIYDFLSRTEQWVSFDPEEA